MDISTLKQKIEDALISVPFTVSGSGLSSTAITTLLKNILGKDSFVLTSASKKGEDDTSITVGGQMASAVQGISNLEATAVFSIADDMAQLSVVLDGLPQGWKPSDTFRELQKSLFDNFTYADSQLLMNSQNLPPLPENYPVSLGYPAYDPAVQARIIQGLGLRTTATVGAGMEGLSWLLGGTSWQMEGPIAQLDKQPLLVLASQPDTGLQIVGFDIPFALEIASVMIFPSADSKAAPVLTSVVQLRADIEKKLDDSTTLDIPVFTRLSSSQTSVLIIESDLADASSVLFNQLTKLIDGADISGQVPSQFPVLNDIQLDNITLGLDIKQKKPVSVAATVSFQDKNKNWPVFGGLIQFEGIAVTFTLVDPGGLNIVETDVVATAVVANGTLEAALSLPDLTFSCELTGDNPIEVSKIVNDIVGNSISMPTIDCTEFKVFGDISGGSYRFQATVTSDWTFNLGSKPFGLTQIGFDLSHTTGASASTSGELVGQFVVGGGQMFVSAAYDTTGTGWTFEGGTLGEQNISLTDLLNDIASLFGASFPSNAPQVVLKNLNISFNTASHDFGFLCMTEITISDVVFDLGVEISLTSQQKTFKGYLWIGESEFEIDFMSSNQQTVITAKWNNQGEPLGIADIAKALNLDPPDIPTELDLGLKSASFTYDFTNKTFVLTADSVNYGMASFVALKVADPVHKDKSSWQFAFALMINKSINLSDLPLVGKELAKIETISVGNFQIILASGAIDQPTVTRINNLILATGTGAPQLPVAALQRSVSIGITMAIGTQSIPLSVTINTGSSQTTDRNLSALPAVATSNGTVMLLDGIEDTSGSGQKVKWFTIQKSFGPVSFEKIGVSYNDGVLWFLLDGSLTLAGLTISLLGMGFGSPLTTFSPHFSLQGLGVDYSNGPLEIGGGLLSVPSSPPIDFEYGGIVVIKTAKFGLSAVGAYASISGTPSMFVFAQYFAPIGGPPYFFLTGLMGGFGYNYNLRIPQQDEVMNFPFVKGINQPDTVGGKGASPLTVLGKLLGTGEDKAWVAPQVGQYWLAFGIQFTSFSIVTSNALLVAEFGQDFQLALIGLATMRLPQVGPLVYVYVELQLLAVFKPQEGFFGISALLTPNSFVIDPACHLTGGFAFYIWFAGDHEGDFVVTIGGYHPAFSVPAWYPQEPRVGFNWSLDSKVTVSGSAYFALTPSAAMAGGSLQVLFQDGNLKAWFTAYADILVYWKPFHFIASIGISVGVSYHLKIWFISKTFKVELGASLDLWGPPTGGKVRISWWIISFSVSFGASRSDNSGPLPWGDFTALLPKPQDIVKIIVNAGLLKEDQDFSDNTSRWVVRPSEFQFTTQAAIPITQIFLGNDTTPFQQGGALDIRLMQKQGLVSKNLITVLLVNTGDVIDLVKEGWSPGAQTGNVPTALWGQQTDNPLQGSQLVPGQLTGITASAPPPSLGFTPGPINIEQNLSYDPLPQKGVMPLKAGLSPSGPLPQAGQNVVEKIADGIMSSPVKTNRDAIYAALQTLQLAPDTNGSLAELAAQAGSLFEAEPLLVNE